MLDVDGDHCLKILLVHDETLVHDVMSHYLTSMEEYSFTNYRHLFSNYPIRLSVSPAKRIKLCTQYRFLFIGHVC